MRGEGGGRGLLPNALPICASCAFAQLRCASEERDDVRDVRRYPPGREPSWMREPMAWPERVT